MAQQNESVLVGFILGQGTDHKGRTLDQILSQDDFWLEHTHDYIQWLFPIPEAGRFNGFAPVLDDKARECFANEPRLQEQQRRALDRMLRFLGLKRRDELVEPMPELNPRDHIWLKRGGHNQLRITRMIRSLHYCHQPTLAKSLQATVINLGKSLGYVQDDTIGYWLRATD